ncbi:MAG: pentapeptide repeat-containing protein [Phormidesmis sp.]
MANTDFLSLIKQGADAWNQWRTANPDCTPDLNNAYLFESVLDHFDFSGVNLERACLIGASLQRTRLQGANLQNTYANDADFTGANLSQAKLNHGIFSSANFTQADLHQAEALGTNFAKACFQNTRTLDWNVDETTILEDEKGEGHTIATARKAEIERLLVAKLTGNVEPTFATPGPLTRSVSGLSNRVSQTLTQLLQPDDANQISPGVLNQAGYLKKIEALRSGAIAHIKAQFGTQVKSLPNRPNRPNRPKPPLTVSRQQMSQKVKAADAFARQHPLPIGAGAIALCATLALTLPRPQPKNPSAVASPLSSATHAHLTAAHESTANQTTNVQIAILSCQEPPPADMSEQAITYEYDSGATFYGTFVDGQPANGRGTMLYPSGNRYDGEYQDGQRNGCGTFSFVDGRRYVGEMRADKLEGKGTWIMKNGERYIGEFKNNQCNGAGMFIFVNGATKSGQWENGRLVGGELLCDRGTLDLPTSADL